MVETVIRDYTELRIAVAARRNELGIPQRELDEIAGLPEGYQGKLEAGVRSFGSLSLPLILQALDCELVFRPRTAS